MPSDHQFQVVTHFIIIIIFCPRGAAFGILVPQPGIEPGLGSESAKS